jgi:chromosome segregation ATPase
MKSSMKFMQSTKTQMTERLRRNEDALRESEQNLVDVQALAQEYNRALEDEKRAHALLQTEIAHVKERLNIEKKRREECELKQQRFEDQAADQSAHVTKLEEEIIVMKQNLRRREVEGLDQSQRADRSEAQTAELQIAIGQVHHDLDALKDEKTKWLDERLELRRAVTELEYVMQPGGDSREFKDKATRNPLTDGSNPQDKWRTATLSQRISEAAAQMRNMRQEHLDALSTNRLLGDKYTGLVKTNDFFRHRIDNVEGLVSFLVSDLRELSQETEGILQETDRVHGLNYSDCSRQAKKVTTLEQRLAQQEAQMKENTEALRSMTRARDDAQASLKRCEQLRASAEDIVRGTGDRSRVLQNNLERAEESNRRAATEIDLLRRTISELESQYKGLQAQSKQSTDSMADELRNTKKEVLRLQAEISQIKTVNVASLANAENKEAARLWACKERDEIGRHLQQIKAETMNLEAELRSVEKERDACRAKLEGQAIVMQGLEHSNKTMSDEVNQIRQQLTTSERTNGMVQSELKNLRASYSKIKGEHAEENNQLSQLQSDLIEIRRLLSSKEAEIESLQTINESMYSEKSNAAEEVARLSHQYRDSKQQEAHLIAELAESRLELNSTARELKDKTQLVEQLKEELARSRQQHSEAAVQASGMGAQLAQMQKEAEKIQQQFVQTITELESLRMRFTDVLRQNTDLSEKNEASSQRLNTYAQSEAEHIAHMQALEESVKLLQADRDEKTMTLSSLMQANSDMLQRNRALESELDDVLGKLHDSRTQNAVATDAIFARDATIITLKDHVQSIEFQKSCLVGDLEMCQKRLEYESKARFELEDVAASRANEIEGLKDLVAKVREEGETRCFNLEKTWQEKHGGLAGQLLETSQAKVAAEQLASERAQTIDSLTQSNQATTQELYAAQQDLKDEQNQKRALEESIEKSHRDARESKKELESALNETKGAFENEKSRHMQASADLQKVTKQRERLREEFITLSQKYKGMMNEADKLANSLDHESRSRLAQTSRAAEIVNLGLESARNEFEDDMLRMALDLKDLMHNQFDHNLESPGDSDHAQITPEPQGLYRSVAAAVVDPRDEVRAISTLGIAKDRIQDLEERLSDRENELSQSTSALKHSHAKQTEAESALLASRQREETLKQEVAVVTASQKQLHAEYLKIRSDYEQAKEMLESRNQELGIQKQAVVDALRELKVQQGVTQGKEIAARQRDGTLSDEMMALRNDYHDAIEAYKMSEMQWTKKVLEAETNLAESMEAAKQSANSCRWLERAKAEMESAFTAKLNDATQAHEDCVHKYEISKAAWDDELEELDRKYKDTLKENTRLIEQGEEAKLAHNGLILQLDQHETELAAAKSENNKLSKANQKLEDQARLNEDTIKGLRDDLERDAKQILELEDTLEKVQENCRHQALKVIDLEGEASKLKSSLEDAESNFNKVTSAYEDLTHRFNLSLNRESDAAAELHALETRLHEFTSLHQKGLTNFNALQTEHAAIKAALEGKTLEVQTLKDQKTHHTARIQTLEEDYDVMQGDVFLKSSHIDKLEARSVSLHEMLLKYETDNLKLQNELQECNTQLIAREKLADEHAILQRDHEILNSSITIVSQQYQTVKNRLSDCEAQLRETRVNLDCTKDEMLTVERNLIKSETQLESCRSEIELLREVLKGEQDKLAQVSAEHQATQKHVILLEEQIQTLSGKHAVLQLAHARAQVMPTRPCAPSHVRSLALGDDHCAGGHLLPCKHPAHDFFSCFPRRDMHMHTHLLSLTVKVKLLSQPQALLWSIAYTLTRAYPRSLSLSLLFVCWIIHSVPRFLGIIVMHEKDKEDMKMNITELKQAHAQSQDDIGESLELAATAVETLNNVVHDISSAALNHLERSRGIANHMEAQLVMLQPIIDEVTYRTADISALRDGHRAWFKAEDKLAHQISVNVHLRAQNETLQRDVDTLSQNSNGQERVLAALREQLEGLHHAGLQHASEKGQLKENLSILEHVHTNSQMEMQELQERLDATMIDLENERARRLSESDRHQKKIVALQSEIAQRARECRQVEDLIFNIEQQTGYVSASLLSIVEQEEINVVSTGCAIGLVENLAAALTPLLGNAQSDRCSLLSEVDRLLGHLAQCRDEIRILKVDNALVKENLLKEEEGCLRANEALAEATHRVNDLQGMVQEYHKDLMGKQRLIAYLEEQQNLLQGSLTAHQVTLKEKEMQMQHMDISWLQDKNQLLRKDDELGRLSKSLVESQEVLCITREYNEVFTNMIDGLERGLSRVGALVQDACVSGNEIVSLRCDKVMLQATQAMLVEVSQRLAFETERANVYAERAHFYAQEVDAKVASLDSGVMQVTEMVANVCQHTSDINELRSFRRLARNLETMLRSTEQSLLSQRAWGQEKESDLKLLETYVQDLEGRLAEKSLDAEKLDNQVLQLSGLVSCLQHEVLELQATTNSQSKDTNQAQTHLVHIESVVDEIVSIFVRAGQFQDRHCDVLQKLCTDEIAPQLDADSPHLLRNLVSKMENMKSRIKELQDTNTKLSANLAKAASTNADYQQTMAEDEVKLGKLVSDLSSREKLVTVLQNQLETVQSLAMSNATEKGKLLESLNSMHVLQARLAETEDDLDRCRKSHFSLQTEKSERFREGLQVQASLDIAEEALDHISTAITRSMKHENFNIESLRGAIGLIADELIVDDLLTQTSSELSENNLVSELQRCHKEVKRIKESLASAETRLKLEKAEHSKTSLALANGRNKINELEASSQGMHIDLLGKHRYIAYLEEQQTSLHSSILEQQNDQTRAITALQEAKTENENDLMMQLQELRSALDARRNGQADADGQHSAIVHCMEIQIQGLETLVSELQKASKSVCEKLTSEQIAGDALRFELKTLRVGAVNLDGELARTQQLVCEKQQLVGLLEKQVQSLNMQILYQETGKIEIEKEALQAAAVRHELHIATLQTCEQKQTIENLVQTIENLQHDMVQKNNLITELQEEVSSLKVKVGRLEQANGVLDSSLSETKERDRRLSDNIVHMQYSLQQQNQGDVHCGILMDGIHRATDDLMDIMGKLVDSVRASVSREKFLEMALAESGLSLQDQRACVDQLSTDKIAQQKLVFMLEHRLRGCMEAAIQNDSSIRILEDAIESTESYLDDIIATAISVESSMGQALTDLGRMRHELLKSRADTVDLSERVCNLEAELGVAKAELGVARSQVLSASNCAELQDALIDDFEKKLGSASHSLQQGAALLVQTHSELNTRKVFMTQLESSLEEQKSMVLQLETSLNEQHLRTSQMTRLHSENQSNQKLVTILENQIHSLHNNIVQKETENQKLAAQIADLEMQNGAQFVEISMLKSRINEYAAPVALVAEYRADAESSERLVQLASDKIEKLEAIILQSDSAVLALRDEVLQSRSRLQRAQLLLGNWQGKVHGFESETVSASQIIAYQHDQIQALQQQISGYVAEKDVLEARLNVMHDIRVEGQAQLKTIQTGLAMERQEIDGLRSINVELEMQIVEMKRMDETKTCLMALMEKAAESSQEQTDSLEKECDVLRNQLTVQSEDFAHTHRELEMVLDDIDDTFFTVVDKLFKSLNNVGADNAYLQSVVARLEGEYEEEQELSSMLQTQVKTLHAVVLQHEALKQGQS